LKLLYEFLQELEAARRIQSAKHIIDLVRQSGRHLPPPDIFARHDPEIREAVRELLIAAPPRKPESDVAPV